MNDEEWSFAAAEDSRLRRASYLMGLDFVHETSERIGRMNIFVAPQGQGTRIEVNAIFGLGMQQQGESDRNNLPGMRNSWKKWGPYEARFRMTTTKPDQQRLGRSQVRCQSSRKWESPILDLVR